MRRFTADYLARTREGLWSDREALANLGLQACDAVLDVGCGTGELSRVLREESGARVVGCDRDPDLLAHLPDDVAAVRGDAFSLPFPDDAFDLVVCQALLVNLTEPGRAVREFVRVARDRVAVVEPDNGAVSVESTVDREAALAARARKRYVAGVETDVALGASAAALLREADLADVRVRRHDHEREVAPPYSAAELEAAARKASGAALRDRREEMAGSEEELDALRSDWREMGRDALEQVRAGDYRRREVVPFYVVTGEV
jgi:SAM-dependent methyltransferase